MLPGIVRAESAFEDKLYGEHPDDFAYDSDGPPATQLRQLKPSRSWPAPLYELAPCGFLSYNLIFLWDMYEHLGHFRASPSYRLWIQDLTGRSSFFEACNPSRHSLFLVLGARLKDEMPTLSAETVEKTVVYLWEAGLVTWFYIGETDFLKKRWWVHVSAKGVSHVVRKLKAKEHVSMKSARNYIIFQAPPKTPPWLIFPAEAIFNHLFQATVRQPGASRQGLNVNLLDRGSGTTSILPTKRAESQDKAVIYYNSHLDRVPRANDARPKRYASALLAIRTNPSKKMLHIAKLLRGERASILARLEHGRNPLPVAAFNGLCLSCAVDRRCLDFGFFDFHRRDLHLDFNRRHLRLKVGRRKLRLKFGRCNL
ncbi:hypothetical protein Rhopal_004513-T1 [Rhodotorula paludigena]|uniref:Uncharacterized protein n=1 Tax=Rhodotorula paludigena TaxID=86838 RepID=A0AAV5GG11_9BASI|nr:hypothetical protein Rhopal_004513-T1 [Rhodotorula paludigena]